jgi:hypothetical protein
VCDTFSPVELGEVLPDLGVAEDAFDRHDPPEWFAWRSPGGDFPVVSCQVWRPPLSVEEADGPRFYTFGPMLSFTRIGGFAGERLDADWFETQHEDVRAWAGELDGEGYTGERDSGRYFMFQRDCAGDLITYTGAAYVGTVSGEEFEPLFVEWIHAQADRDGCPVAG